MNFKTPSSLFIGLAMVMFPSAAAIGASSQVPYEWQVSGVAISAEQMRDILLLRAISRRLDEAVVTVGRAEDALRNIGSTERADQVAQFKLQLIEMRATMPVYQVSESFVRELIAYQEGRLGEHVRELADLETQLIALHKALETMEASPEGGNDADAVPVGTGELRKTGAED